MPGKRDRLAEVTEAARKAASARNVLEKTIKAAAQEHSLRAVADAAGTSHEQVRRIISPAKGRSL